VDGALDVESSSNVRLANSKVRIKPTAPLSAFDKENSIEFSLDSLHYLYNYLLKIYAVMPRSLQAIIGSI